MGYDIYQHDNHFLIKKENFGKALDLLKSAFTEENLKYYGYPDFDGEKDYNWHFGGIDTDSVLKAETITDAMSECLWEVVIGKDGDIDRIYYDGGKAMSEEAILKAIAPCVENGSYIEMEGEDGELWRWNFRDGLVIETQPEIIWPEV